VRWCVPARGVDALRAPSAGEELRLSRLARPHIAPHSPCLPAGRLGTLSGLGRSSPLTASPAANASRLRRDPRKALRSTGPLMPERRAQLWYCQISPPVAEVSALGGFDIGEATSVCARTGQSISPWWCETSTPITPYHSRAVSTWGWASAPPPHQPPPPAHRARAAWPDGDRRCVCGICS
jgi:hypothetical protein